MKYKFIAVFGFILIFMLSPILSYADNNGVWHLTKDIRVGTFGSDEGDSISEYKFINPLVVENNLNVSVNSGRGIYSKSSLGDGIAGVTSAVGKSGIYGWAQVPGSYSGYFEGGNFIVMNGNVGIGTTNIDNKLEIGGNLEIQIDDLDNRLRFHDPNDAWYSAGIDVSDSRKFKINYGENVGDNNHFVLTTSGNVGIGKSNPTQKLDVGGNIGAKDIYSNNELVATKNYVDNEIAALDMIWDKSGSDIYYNSGDVGIGTSNPSVKLEVVDDIGSSVIAQFCVPGGRCAEIVHNVETKKTSTSSAFCGHHSLSKCHWSPYDTCNSDNWGVYSCPDGVEKTCVDVHGYNDHWYREDIECYTAHDVVFEDYKE